MTDTTYDKFLPPDPSPKVLMCPACEHPIHEHSDPKYPGSISGCNCYWTPNDIAHVAIVAARTDEQEWGREIALGMVAQAQREMAERIAAALVDQCPFKLLHHDYACRCKEYAKIARRAGGIQ